MLSKDPRLSIEPGTPGFNQQKDYVDRVFRLGQRYRDDSMTIWKNANEFWDLFLAIQEDTRDPIDEQWRSDVFVPLPFITTRNKAAQAVELLANAEPVWQVEATRESGNWYDQSKHIERLLEYTHRMNSWRKFLHKLCTARSVQGTSFFKLTYQRRAHMLTLFPTDEENQVFEAAVQRATMAGAPTPPPPTDPGFDVWRDMVNMSNASNGNQFGIIPAYPQSGPTEIVEYEGPVFQYLPLWTVRLDPMIDEIENQKCIIHRMVKPMSYLLQRADDDPNSDKPYYLSNIQDAEHGWDGQILEDEEQELAQSLGLTPMDHGHPYYQDAVELLEVYTPEEDYKYAIIMNRSRVINKRPFEHPLLTTAPAIFALRNIIVPGHFYGLSDYQEPYKLFRELNTFRRSRMDGAVLTTLPVFVKQAGFTLNEAMKKVRPGMIITAPTKDAITSLIKHTLPPEAYREPQEIKGEIEEATEVNQLVKGTQATVGRVTGTEYQGRTSQVLLKHKIDASIIEEELQHLPPVILSFFAQMGPGRIRKEIGGDPDALVDVTRSGLIQAIGMRFRMRGATKNLSPDLQVQQLTTAVNNFKDVLTPAERRFGLQLIMELLDVRGYSKVLSLEGGQQVQAAGEGQMGAVNAQNLATQQEAMKAGVEVPGAIDGAAASALGGGAAPAAAPAPTQGGASGQPAGGTK